MLWQDLTTNQFSEWIEKSGGVCLLPIGVLEGHGKHLPVGTDMFIARAVCERAAELEPAVVFPYYFMGQIAEGRHYKGAIAASHRLMMDALREMCDEIGRNGFSKILIVNSHGGNNSFCRFFAEEMPRLDRTYCVYTCSGAQSRYTAEQRKKICALSGTDDLGSHGGLSETATVLYLRPDLVRMDDQTPDEGVSQNRLRELAELGVYSGFNWYADYPNHYAGDHTMSTTELGKMMFDMRCENVVKIIRAVKADNVSGQLVREYIERGRNPE